MGIEVAWSVHLDFGSVCKIAVFFILTVMFTRQFCFVWQVVFSALFEVC